MNQKQFADKVSNPANFSSQDRGWLKAMLAKYPYSSVVGTLSLLADHVYGFDTTEERRAVALSVCNPAVLDKLIAGAGMETVAEAEPTPKPSPKPTPTPTPSPTLPEEPSFDVLNEINTFQEVSFKTAPKSVILSNFLSFETSKGGNTEGGNEEKQVFNDKKSLVADSSLGTETLAIILKNQGRYDKALAIYEKLLAHNPEKSSTFAPRIEELKSLIKSK